MKIYLIKGIALILLMQLNLTIGFLLFISFLILDILLICEDSSIERRLISLYLMMNLTIYTIFATIGKLILDWRCC